MSSKRLVLRPPSLVNVFPCMGSQAHTTTWPSASTARTRPGSSSVMRSDPRRVMSVRRPGRRSGFNRSHSATTSAGRAVGPDLDPDRVVDAGHELEVGPVELARAVADPDHVGRAVVPIAGEGVHAGEAFLVGEDQRFVAREEVDLVQPLLGREVDAAGRHEAQGAVDLRGDALVALALAGRGDELLVPQVHLGEVGEAALGERPQEVERRRRLLVRGHQARRVRPCAPRPRRSRR